MLSIDEIVNDKFIFVYKNVISEQHNHYLNA